MPHVRVVGDRPQINVKDRTVWARHHDAGPLMAELPQPMVDDIYNGVVADFWEDIAPDVAREHGYSGDLCAEGRSGGWLELADSMPWLDYITPGDPRADREPFYIPPADDDADEDTRQEYAAMIAQRDRFLTFATAIEGAVKAAGEMFVQRLQEACSDLEERREAMTVRSVN